jgi:putative membrane protein
MKNSIEVERGYISYMRQLLENNAPDESINSVLNQLTVTANDISSYLNEVQPLNSMGSSIDDNLKNYDNMLQSMGTVASQLDSLADAGTLINQASVRQIDQMSKRVGDIESKLNDLDIKMKTVNEKSLDNIIGIMEKNPDQISDLLSSPVELKNVQLYNLGLFGYAVTPFYTTLSIWVGVLLFGIILTLKYKKSDVGIKLNMAHRYFGKLLLFIILSFIQTLIVLFGEFFILGIRPESEITMVIVALTTSIAFTSIIFTLIFTFGNFGKGISAIIMILQLFSTGGIYPIEIISSRLAALAPFLPFTYSIGGLREAMAGPNWTNLSKSLMILFFFAAGFLLLVPIKKIFHKPISRMESEFQRSGL